MRAFAVTCILAAAAGAQETYTFTSRHYEVTTDLDRDLARDITDHMDLVFDEYARRLAAFRVRNAKRVRMHLYREYEDYLDFIAAQGMSGRNTGGMFLWSGGNAYLLTYVEGQSERGRERVLQHEGFHQFAHLRIGSDLPPWANEGLADYFGVSILVGRRLRTGLVPAGRLEAIQDAVARDDHIPFAELLSLTTDAWAMRVVGGDPRSGLMYLQSWSMVHFLVNADRGRYARMFERYLELISQGRESMGAFREAFGTDDLHSFEKAWARYVEDLEPDALSTATERLEFLGAGLAMLHEQGVAPDSIEALRDALRERGFEVHIGAHGIRRTLSADQDDLFEPPAPERRGRAEPALALTPPDPGMPPGIEVTGLRTRVSLVWSREEDRLRRRIEYR